MAVNTSKISGLNHLDDLFLNYNTDVLGNRFCVVWPLWVTFQQNRASQNLLIATIIC